MPPCTTGTANCKYSSGRQRLGRLFTLDPKLPCKGGSERHFEGGWMVGWVWMWRSVLSTDGGTVRKVCEEYEEEEEEEEEEERG